MITLPCYATREDVKSALDVKQTARNDQQVDRAIDGASRAIDGLMNRVFYPALETHYWDWPNFQYAYPWRIWFDQAELADVTTTVPVVTSGGTVIPNANIFWGNPRYAPPYTYMELDRSASSSFGNGDTPQRDVAITGMFGYSVNTKSGGTLAASVSTTSATTLTVSDGSLIGVGDQILVGTERMLVTDRANTTSSQTLQTPLTDLDNDVNVAVSTGSAFHVGEVITLDTERMLVVDVTGNNLTVIRGWDGSVLATHTGSTVYVSRLLTVVRGSQGTTAATHSNGDTVYVHAVPPLIKQLAVAEAVVMLTQEAGAYAQSQGAGGDSSTIPQKKIGQGIESLRNLAVVHHSRRGRKRVI